MKKLSSTGFAVEHDDGHLYVVGVQPEFRGSEIERVVLLNEVDQGILIIFQNGDEQIQFFPDPDGSRDQEATSPGPLPLTRRFETA